MHCSRCHCPNCADPSACNYNPNYVEADYSFVTEVLALATSDQLVGSLGTTDLTGYSCTRVCSNPPTRTIS